MIAVAYVVAYLCCGITVVLFLKENSDDYVVDGNVFKLRCWKYIYIYISQRSDKNGCMVPSILQFQFKINIKEGQDMRKNVVYLKSL